MNLEIKMFGGFSMYYQGERLQFERNNTTRCMHVLQMLLYHNQKGVSKDALIKILFGEDEFITDPANNLKVIISNLRRILKRAGLPEDTTIVFKGGSYYFVSDIPLEVDVHLFEQQVKKARQSQGEGLKRTLETICSLYGGEFLPHLETCEWVMVAAAHYKEEYSACIRKLVELLKQEKKHDQIQRLTTQAWILCPREEWSVLCIESLLAMERYQEAKEVYEETVGWLEKEFDVTHSSGLTDCLRQLERVIPSRKATLEQMQSILQEEGAGKGAYYCPFPSFIDTYRTVSRMVERTGQSVYLLMCWITDKKGHRIEDKAVIAQVMPQLGEAIRSSLRRGDIYTKAEADRYLILLAGINFENCSVVFKRIDTHFKNLMRGVRTPAVQLHYKLAPVSENRK